MRPFAVLSDVEFEELVADLFAAEHDTPVERFARGRDGGVDLRWRDPLDGSFVIGQCKHYARSTMSQLVAAARAELDHLSKLRPPAYRFITSFDLTVGQKKELYQVFSEWMTGPDDVFGSRDIDGLLTRHDDVERRHTKLWVSSGSQLFWATHSGLANRSSALRDRIEHSLPRYVLNSGYGRARDLLDEHRVCIIAGLPGIGKTMLAQVLLADAMTLGYEPFEVSRDIEEAWIALRGQRLQVFLYDDFLGQLSFSERLAKNEDRRLTDFIAKVSSTKTKLLVMTTREYILQDARRTYELMSSLDQRMHFVLALEDYTRTDRARILYNHLWQAELSATALEEVASGGYRAIVDHVNYSPRLVEYCTRPTFDTQAAGYAERFVELLDHPDRLWRTAFEEHLTQEQQLLAVALTTLPPDAHHDDLEVAHRRLCELRNVPVSAAQFRAALQVMEGSFIAVGRFEGEPTVRFHNPSARQFTLDWLAGDPSLLTSVLSAAVFFEQAVRLYAHASPTSELTPLANALVPLRAEVVSALARLMDSPSPERRREWVRGTGQILRPQSGWLESRFLALLDIPVEWRPDSAWALAAMKTLVGRWREGQGEKASAVRLIRRVAELVSDLPDSITGEILEEAERALDEWLVRSLDETEDDWIPYLDRLERDLGRDLAEETAVADRFKQFTRQELHRWSPSPPNLDELVDYATRFQLPELVEALEDKLAEERERDERAGEQVSRPRAKPMHAVSEPTSDEALDELFLRLRHRGGCPDRC